MRLESCPGGVVRRQVGRVPRDEVAPDPRLGVNQIGEHRLEVAAYFQCVRHPARARDGGRGAAQRRRAHRDDDDDGDGEPDLDLALEGHAGGGLTGPGRRSSCGSTYFV